MKPTTPVSSGRNSVSKKLFVPFLATLILASVHLAQAQQAKIYRVGVIYEGGPLSLAIDGLQDGLRELGYETGKHYVLEIRDLKGDRTAAEEAGRSLEQKKVDLIYVVSTSVVTLVRRTTTEVPIVFAVGSDPVAAGLIDSFARPGGRLTGVHFLSADLTAKRLEILKEILPEAHRVVTFYDPRSEVAVRAATSAREAAMQLKVEIVERPVKSVEDLQRSLKALKTQEVDAYFYTQDAMVVSQSQFIIDVARSKKLPTMFGEVSAVAQGALVSYGVSYYEVGRLSAKYIQRILTGTSPQSLPVESLSRLALVVNLKTAHEIGVTIPQSLLLRANEVIQ
jgi:putative tryptophan/tyrosine transport system substrate-binding protein